MLTVNDVKRKEASNLKESPVKEYASNFSKTADILGIESTPKTKEAAAFSFINSMRMQVQGN